MNNFLLHFFYTSPCYEGSAILVMISSCLLPTLTPRKG